MKKVFAAPGNAGTAAVAENLNLRPTDTEGLGKAAKEKGIDLVVVGPEAPLASGIVDYFDNLGIPVFGPTKVVTQLESSKVFARNLMEKYGIPCPKGAIFSSYSKACEYLQEQRPPVVIKADGLAAGKGVLIAGYLFCHPGGEKTRWAIASHTSSVGTLVIIPDFLIVASWYHR